MTKLIYTNEKDDYFLVKDKDAKETRRFYFVGNNIIKEFAKEDVEEVLKEEGVSFEWVN